MEKLVSVERKSFIPFFSSSVDWKRLTPNKVVEINFDNLEVNLNNDMRLNASNEAKSIELAANFRTNS